MPFRYRAPWSTPPGCRHDGGSAQRLGGMIEQTLSASKKKRWRRIKRCLRFGVKSGRSIAGSEELRLHFLGTDIQYGDRIRQEVVDDFLLADALRLLLPAYQGPGLRLSEGKASSTAGAGLTVSLFHPIFDIRLVVVEARFGIEGPRLVHQPPDAGEFSGASGNGPDQREGRFA
jgi:hypothetical protein